MTIIDFIQNKNHGSDPSIFQVTSVPSPSSSRYTHAVDFEFHGFKNWSVVSKALFSTIISILWLPDPSLSPSRLETAPTSPSVQSTQDLAERSITNHGDQISCCSNVFTFSRTTAGFASIFFDVDTWNEIENRHICFSKVKYFLDIAIIKNFTNSWFAFRFTKVYQELWVGTSRHYKHLFIYLFLRNAIRLLARGNLILFLLFVSM